MSKETKSNALKKKLLEALEKSLGVVTTACKSVDCNRASYYRYYEDDEEFKKAVDELSNVALDFAESKLHGQIAKGDTTATIFFLKTKGKKRGYVEKHEIDTNMSISWHEEKNYDKE